MSDRFRRLRIYNLIMGAFHALQGVAILALANDFALPVTASFMDGPPGSSAPELTRLFEVRVAYGVAAFVFLSAVAHWILAGPAFGWYVKSLEKYRNYARWLEYSISSSIMIVLIAMLTGIGDVAALVALFGVNSSMIFFGWLMEKYEEPGNPSWLGYWFGVIAGAVPWIAIGIYLLSPTVDASPPA